MPAFDNVLSDQEIRDVLGFIQAKQAEFGPNEKPN
jgi:mono/diheme cytochrome c family protein